ncbi:NAD(P)/FAD-dependent oxidoreductase [Mangrovicella endophytica]|uniref:NAD(P)/FAD-dependent oxidoreductase n=1 Tax=Mangrovicella endophytica TaxID=2066697 RepID=UPI000C9E6832|nr:FAD-dependent oxidoreductase [Mangrovicella endophytica]
MSPTASGLYSAEAAVSYRAVVLVGGGHAHLGVLERAPAFRQRGARLILIDPGRFWYSGRAAGLLGGRFSPDEASIGLAALAQRRGAAHVAAKVTDLDRAKRRVHLSDGSALPYDFVSFAIGSRTHSPWPLDDVAIAGVKPVGTLVRLRERLLAERPGRIVVIGDGASAAEITGNLLHLLQATSCAVTLIGAAPRLLPGVPAGLATMVERSLAGRGADIRLGLPVKTIKASGAVLADGSCIAADRVIVATGLEAEPLVSGLGLPTQDSGLLVDATLRSVADERVFSAGDCAALAGHRLPKLGVYGVREAPVLSDNLLAALDGGPLRAYRPQRHALAILDLADGRGYAARGRLWWHGRSALRLKSWLDGRFLARYRA